MPRFGRKETFIASHYTHDFRQSPVAFHPIQPLTWGTYMAYGDLGYTWSKVAYLGSRKLQSTLRENGSNVAVYDLYDAVNHLDDRTGSGRYTTALNDIRTISSYDAMSVVAANNSSAALKTAYWIKLAGLIMNDSNLVKVGDDLSEVGYSEGEQPGSASHTGRIAERYNNADSLIRTSSKYASNGAKSSNVKIILDSIAKGMSQKNVEARVNQARKDEEATKKNIPVDEGGTKPPETEKCEDTWLGKIPGYCASQQAFTYAMYGVAALTVVGTAWWAYGKFKGTPAANPAPRLRRARTNGRGSRLLNNPSAPGVMDGEPELEIANLPAAKKQEKNLANTSFRVEKK